MNRILIKRIVLTLLLSPVIFLIICNISEINDLPADGALTFGFPMTFYIQSYPETAAAPGETIFYFALIIDILFTLLMSIIAYEMIRRAWNIVAWAFS